LATEGCLGAAASTTKTWPQRTSLVCPPAFSVQRLAGAGRSTAGPAVTSFEASGCVLGTLGPEPAGLAARGFRKFFLESLLKCLMGGLRSVKVADPSLPGSDVADERRVSPIGR